jgi:CRP/FNR family transcriptional regulator, cyclic AMP receptor protein
MIHILVIEDNTEVRENTAEILELANYKVSTAGDGKQGVEKALAHKPDLIVCDVMMPVLDGYGVLHLLNKNPELQGIPFIFLTAKAERSDLRKGMELGADDYITKPFTEFELLTAIESRLEKAAHHKHSTSQPAIADDAIGARQALDDFAKNRHQDNYKKKQVIYSEGNHPTKLYFIEKGKVKTFKTNSDGKDFTTGLYGEGDYIGYVAALENTVYKETAEAIDDTVVAIIPVEEFRSLMANNQHAMQLFIQLLAKNVRTKEDQLLGLAYNSLRKRVADALITLQQKYQAENQERFSINISREDLANIAGTATESLIRTLSDFKSEKLIEIAAGSIVILNQKKLADMLN